MTTPTGSVFRVPAQTLFVLGGLVLLGAVVLASSGGAFSIAWFELPSLVSGDANPLTALQARILFEVRLPRVVFSAVVGGALALAGVVMQALFRNPLAEPGLVGISSGAALGAVIAIVLTSGSFLVVAGFAFAGSLLATGLAYHLGRAHPGVSGLLLAGIAINTVAGSVLGVLTYAADDTQLRDLTFWSMGSLAGAHWSMLIVVLPLVCVLMTLTCWQWRTLNALLLGEHEASHLGFRSVQVRRRLIVLTALLVGPLVALTGGIGFVGLVVPHLVRLLVGANHCFLMPLSVLTGAALLTLADWGARVWLAPAELPVGLVTSLVGGPFFFLLLVRFRGRF